MEIVLRPVNDRFLAKVAFPAFEAGVRDATAGLELLRRRINDERTRSLLELLLDQGVHGSFFSLEEHRWLETVYRLLFWDWVEEADGWRMGGEYSGFAGEWERMLHLALMLEQPFYPYFEAGRAEAFRNEFLQTPEAETGLASLISGRWEPFPPFPPDQVLTTVGRAIYRPGQNLALADWCYRPAQAVEAWCAQLPHKLSRLLSRESRRLHPVEAPEVQEILDHWLGRTERAPLLAVSFTGLGFEAKDWIFEIGALARQIRAAGASGRGLTAIITNVGRSMFEGAAGLHGDR